MDRIIIKQPLKIPEGNTLPAGTEITTTEEWVTVPYRGENRVILMEGRRYSVMDDDLEACQRDALDIREHTARPLFVLHATDSSVP